MNNTNKNPPSFESGFCLAPLASLERSDLPECASKLALPILLRFAAQYWQFIVKLALPFIHCHWFGFRKKSKMKRNPADSYGPISHLKQRLNEIALCAIKSSLCSDEIFGSASDEIKSASTIPTKSDFIAKRFHPPKVDLFRHRRI